jgi:hypothetical protein
MLREILKRLHHDAALRRHPRRNTRSNQGRGRKEEAEAAAGRAAIRLRDIILNTIGNKLPGAMACRDSFRTSPSVASRAEHSWNGQRPPASSCAIASKAKRTTEGLNFWHLTQLGPSPAADIV